MKKILIALLLIINGFTLFAQLNSGTISVPPTAQPVPNATAKEKAAIPQPQNVAPAQNPIPPIYPGADVKSAETQRELIFPASTPSGTQSVQKEPLSPIESTKNLKPNRPQREAFSRENTAIGLQKTIHLNNKLVRKPTVKQIGNTNIISKINAKSSNTYFKQPSAKLTTATKQRKKTSKTVIRKVVASKKSILKN